MTLCAHMHTGRFRQVQIQNCSNMFKPERPRKQYDSNFDMPPALLIGSGLVWQSLATIGRFEVAAFQKQTQPATNVVPKCLGPLIADQYITECLRLPHVVAELRPAAFIQLLLRPGCFWLCMGHHGALIFCDIWLRQVFNGFRLRHDKLTADVNAKVFADARSMANLVASQIFYRLPWKKQKPGWAAFWLLAQPCLCARGSLPRWCCSCGPLKSFLIDCQPMPA